MNEKVIQTLLGELQKISRAETVIGDAIRSGDNTIVPISRVQIGFGAGSTIPNESADGKGSGDKGLNGNRSWNGSGVGGGIRVEPVACIVVNKDGKAQLLQFSEPNLSTTARIIDLVPEVMERLGLTKGDHEKDEPEKTVPPKKSKTKD